MRGEETLGGRVYWLLRWSNAAGVGLRMGGIVKAWEIHGVYEWEELGFGFLFLFWRSRGLAFNGGMGGLVESRFSYNEQ